MKNSLSYFFTLFGFQLSPRETSETRSPVKVDEGLNNFHSKINYLPRRYGVHQIFFFVCVYKTSREKDLLVLLYVKYKKN